MKYYIINNIIFEFDYIFEIIFKLVNRVTNYRNNQYNYIRYYKIKYIFNFIEILEIFIIIIKK